MNIIGVVFVIKTDEIFTIIKRMKNGHIPEHWQLKLWIGLAALALAARYHGQNRAFELRLWERSEGHLGIPDMTVIVSVFYISGLVANAQTEANAISLWIRDAAKANGFRHIADESHGPMDAPNQVPGCKIACLTL